MKPICRRKKIVNWLIKAKLEPTTDWDEKTQFIPGTPIYLPKKPDKH
jgi:hypothetical protein